MKYSVTPKKKYTVTQGTAASSEPFTDSAVSVARQSEKEFNLQREQGVDYSTGVKNAGFRAGLSQMSGNEEALSFMEGKVGKGNVGKDSFGAWVISPAGLKNIGIESDKPIAVDEQGVTRYDVADWAGDLPAVAGATALGAATGGGGAIPSIFAAALGGAGGKGIQETVKNLLGHRKRGPLEIGLDVASEGGAAGLGEGVFRLGARLLKGYSPGVSEARKTLTKEALDQGLTPRTYQFLEENQAPILKRFQAVGEKVLSDPQQTNRKILLDKASGFKSRAGSTTDISAPTGVEPGLTPPVGDVGEKLIGSVKGGIDSSARQIEQIKQRINVDLEASRKGIEASLGDPSILAGKKVSDSVVAARRKFSDDASVLYDKVDELLGGPFVPTRSLKKMAARIAEQLPKTADGRVVFAKPGEVNPIKDILDLPENITVGQAQRIRTMLREGGFSRDMVPGADKHDLLLLKQSSEKMFDDAIGNAGGGSWSGQAIRALKEADAFYRAGIKKFDYPAVAAITRDASQTGSVDPEKVIDYVIRPGRSSNVERIKGLVSPEVWKNVTREHFDSMIANSAGADDKISGKRLFDQVKKMGKTLDSVYGQDAQKIRKYAYELAAADGKIDPSMITGEIGKDIAAMAKKQRELDAFMKDNYLSSLAKPGQEAEQAADYIFRPNSPNRIAQARNLYGENSDAFRGLQQHSMDKLLASFIEKTDDPLTQVLNGAKLKESLNQYGQKTISEMFGPELAKDLFRFADVAELVTKRGPLGAGGIVAAQTALHPISNIGKIADLFLVGKLLRYPGFIRYLTDGISANTPTKKSAAAIARAAAIATAVVDDETSSSVVEDVKEEVMQ